MPIKYKRTMGLDVPHPFAKKVEAKKKGRKPVQGPPPPPKKKGRPRTREYIPPKQKKVVKPPRKITLPTGRAMDEAITKIQPQLLIEKDKLKKMNMGGVMKNRGGTFKGVF